MLLDTPPTNGLTGIASIVAALAWPTLACVLVIWQRTRISRILEILTAKLDSAQSFKTGPLEFSVENKIQGALSGVVGDLTSAKPGEKVSVPESQVKSAQALQQELAQTDEDTVERTVRSQIESLAKEYEGTRAFLAPSPARTVKMQQIMGKMRTLSLVAEPLLPQLRESKVAGERLAAIAILQVRPNEGYSGWLAQRMSAENQPFILFQAALALKELASEPRIKNKGKLRSDVDAALNVVISYTDGEPDKNTISVLEETLQSLTPAL